MTSLLSGIHHVTAITDNVQQNIDFYTRVLGLRLVKRTVSFTDSEVEHLFYGDWSGTPGTVITFFGWPEGERGRQGTGAVGEVAFTIPRSSLAFWVGHLIRVGVRYSGPAPQFGEQVLAFRDPDGLLIELVASAEAEQEPGWEGGPLPAEHSIRGLHHVTLWEQTAEPTTRLLTEVLGFRVLASEETTARYAVGAGGPGRLVHVRSVANFWPSAGGVGTVHHVAWRTQDVEAALAWRDALAGAGVTTTPLLDRRYFQSIYFQEPGGVIFEIATDGPGFTIDETVEQLGTQVQKLPDAAVESDTLAEAQPPAEEITMNTQNRTGAELGMAHQFVAGQAANAPTLLLLHGTGGDEHDLLDLGRMLYPGAALLSPRGQVLENGMPRFFRRLAEGVFDLEDLRRRTDDLAEFVAGASAVYGFDPKRVIAVGYSNGANIAASLLLQRPGVLAGAVLFHAMVPFVPEQLPDLAGVPVFMGAGRTDTMIRPQQTEGLARLLQQAGAEVALHWEQGGHALARGEVQAAAGWLREHREVTL